ncbi:hypothetical protein NPA07_00585 [Mycoplasmopsis caviae]|uniref:Uncharacterized protein n=1 Tax=Mycoplasmopsis caviae TaxID=55603 RepID=A0ABY5J131_9BACT|nr:hypothetical protein [Mycoplasmopsis caviae]UUD35362.1 hypothetical protein NPA07_00585 [Mycoplasmopsis caviae]
MKKRKEISKHNMCEIYESFSFIQPEYKSNVNSLKNKNENDEFLLKAKMESASALNEYIDSKLERKKIRISNKKISRISSTFIPLIVFFLTIVLIVVAYIAYVAANYMVKDTEVYTMFSISVVSLIVATALFVVYFKKYSYYTNDKAKYFEKKLREEIKIGDLKSMVLKNKNTLNFQEDVPSLTLASDLKYPDIPAGYKIETEKYAKRFTLYGMNVLAQDATLVKIDKKESEKAETDKSIIQEKSKKIKIFEFSFMNSQFDKIYLPFVLFNKFEAFDSKLEPIKSNIEDIDKVFNIQAIKNPLNEKLFNALKLWKNNVHFAKTFIPQESGINYFNFKLTAIFTLKDNCQDEFSLKTKAKEWKNPFKIELPAIIDDSTKLPMWFIINNFYKVVDYIAYSKAVVEKYVMPMVFYLFNEINDTKVFSEKTLSELYTIE